MSDLPGPLKVRLLIIVYSIKPLYLVTTNYTVEIYEPTLDS
jgi:hypothetical protein